MGYVPASDVQAMRSPHLHRLRPTHRTGAQRCPPSEAVPVRRDRVERASTRRPEGRTGTRWRRRPPLVATRVIPRCATPAFTALLALAIVTGTVVAAVGSDTAALVAAVTVTALPVVFMRRKARHAEGPPTP
jgi:hypothetical protein